jgi:hypothetical protein
LVQHFSSRELLGLDQLHNLMELFTYFLIVAHHLVVREHLKEVQQVEILDFWCHFYQLLFGLLITRNEQWWIRLLREVVIIVITDEVFGKPFQKLWQGYHEISGRNI